MHLHAVLAHYHAIELASAWNLPDMDTEPVALADAAA
jgi:hypothetical protein